MERTASLRTGKYLYVQAPRRELYDEAADPKSEHNLATEMKAVADTVGDRLETFRQKTSSKREAPRMSEDPAAQAKLAALDTPCRPPFRRPEAMGRKPIQGQH